MNNSIEKQGKTVQEAVDLALEELNVDKSQVYIDVIDEGSKGFLGLKSRPAKVIVTVNEEQELQEVEGESADEIAVNFLLEVFKKMDVKVSLNVKVYDDEIRIDVFGDDVGIAIGRRGETLDALQYLTNLAVNRKVSEYKRVNIDIENYREKRNDTLVKLARRMANQAIKTGREVVLEPMNPAERRIIHSTLQKNNRVETKSIGEDPKRRIVIRVI